VIVATDVHYDDANDQAFAAAVCFDAWTDSAPTFERTRRVEGLRPYRPGSFYERELPCLLAALDGLDADLIIVDGHAVLDGRPGLGGHLHAALDVPVVGVAKASFSNGEALPLLRGRSERPLWVSAVGLSHERARQLVGSMAGPHRIPTLLKRADALARAQGTQLVPSNVSSTS